jgi:Lon protease-like protein
MTPSEDMLLPENVEKLRILMDKYDKMAEDAMHEDQKMRRSIQEDIEKAKKG